MSVGLTLGWRLGGAVVVSLGVVSAGGARAQETGLVARTELPDAPSMVLQEQTVHAAGMGGVAGRVVDGTGAAVSGAQVTLTGAGVATPLETTADINGVFGFVGLRPGAYRLVIASPGMAEFSLNDVPVAAGGVERLPDMAMRVLATSSSVQVFADEHDVAQAQVHAQEKQRVLGIVPNFYSSYIWNAEPMTQKMKYKLAGHAVLDPLAFAVAAGVGGVEQAHNTFPGYGRGPASYGKRAAAAYGDTLIGRLMGSAILPSIFRQDPRYFYRGTGSFFSRAVYAVGATVICRGDNGKQQPNFSHVLGNFAAAGISNLYRDASDRQASLTIRNGFIITGSNAVANLVREFLLRGLTAKVPSFEQGKASTRPAGSSK